jgi:hypothetical protein
MAREVGRGLPRIDAWDEVAGRACCAGEFSMPRTLHAKVV